DKQREAQEAVYEEIHKKLLHIRKSLVIESDTESKYKLEQRIRDYEQQLQKIEADLDLLEGN
ncbi:MAG: hypothetical protein WBA10_05105, partial [Elainellaceae cyanobacterium]